MARVRGMYLRQPPKGPSAYTSKEAALAASPKMVVVDGAFPKNQMESVKNAAFRVNSGGRGQWSPQSFFAIWDYAPDLVLRVKPEGSEGENGEGEGSIEGTGSVEVLGFVENNEVIGEDGKSIGTLDSFLGQEGVETGGWVLLIGAQPNVPEGWAEIVNAPGSRRRRKRGSSDSKGSE